MSELHSRAIARVSEYLTGFLVTPKGFVASSYEEADQWQILKTLWQPAADFLFALPPAALRQPF